MTALIANSAVWHDLECGGYAEDLDLWRELAARNDGPVLEAGAGTGRVSIHLAQRGHDVTALDYDGTLLERLSERSRGLPITVVEADARTFDLPVRFGLCLIAMQTIQLLGGKPGRLAFLSCAKRHLAPGGELGVVFATELEDFEVEPGGPAPLPDVLEDGGRVLWSQPTAVRVGVDSYTLERRREIVEADGRRELAYDRIRLDRLTAAELEAEGEAVGLLPCERRTIAPTREYAGSEVVIFGG